MGSRKRKAKGSDAADDGAAGPSSAEHEEDDILTPYEREREALIALNLQRMAALGIPAAISALNKVAAQAKPPPPKKHKKKPKGPPQAPSRQSSRLRGETSHADDEASELALFVINEACPRCGKVLTRMQKQHLAKCTAVRPADREPVVEIEGMEDEEEDEEDEEQLAQIKGSKEAERKQRMDAKLKELQLDGLVGLDDKEAKFVVLGSTKNHYNVTLSDERQTCQCVDFRIRRHNCKHIRLVLMQLGIADKPEDWHKAVESKLGQALKPDQDGWGTSVS